MTSPSSRERSQESGRTVTTNVCRLCGGRRLVMWPRHATPAWRRMPRALRGAVSPPTLRCRDCGAESGDHGIPRSEPLS